MKHTKPTHALRATWYCAPRGEQQRDLADITSRPATLQSNVTTQAQWTRKLTGYLRSLSLALDCTEVSASAVVAGQEGFDSSAVSALD